MKTGRLGRRQSHIRRRDTLAHGGRSGAEFIAAEYLSGGGHLQAGTGSACGGSDCRDGVGDREITAGASAAGAAGEQQRAGVTLLQFPVHLLLKLADGLVGVPSRRPRGGDEARIRLRRHTLHGEGQHRLPILRLLRLMHIDIGQNRGAPAVTMRLTGQFHPARHLSRVRQHLAQRPHALTGGGTFPDRLLETPRPVQPTPGRKHPVLRPLHLHTQLGAALIIDIGGVMLVETGDRQHQMGAGGGGGGQLIQHRHRLRLAQGRLHRGGGGAPEQVVLQHQQMPRLTGVQPLQRLG